MYMRLSRRQEPNRRQISDRLVFSTISPHNPVSEVAMAQRKARPFTETEEKLLDVAVKLMTKPTNWVYRASGGRLGGRFLRGAPVMLLTTIGRRSGRPRTAPLIYLEDGDRVVVVASKGGSARHPLWYRNLQANPDVEVQIGSEKRELRARTASAEEKDELWPRLTMIYPDYDDYQARTDRDIPIVILEPH
jgi:deazaflavin-dependent oxidoreductase (nitroreductase family)